MASGRRTFSTAEYARMFEFGILTEDQRVELIDGDVLDMPPVGARHNSIVARLQSLLASLDATYTVEIEHSVRLNDRNEPKPDLAVILADKESEPPHLQDFVLIIEVADDRVAYDREMKLPLYAKAKIPEVWLIDLTADMIEQYTQPKSGKYTRHTCQQGETITSAAVPSVQLNVSDILG